MYLLFSAAFWAHFLRFHRKKPGYSGAPLSLRPLRGCSAPLLSLARKKEKEKPQRRTKDHEGRPDDRAASCTFFSVKISLQAACLKQHALKKKFTARSKKSKKEVTEGRRG
jgi:hypothetical protein